MLYIIHICLNVSLFSIYFKIEGWFSSHWKKPIFKRIKIIKKNILLLQLILRRKQKYIKFYYLIESD